MTQSKKILITEYNLKMEKIKKPKKKSKYDLSNFDAELNFAYCPSKALTIQESLLTNTEEFKDLASSLDDESTIYMSMAMKYFYICYSITVENLNLEDNNYFFFQLFSQIGDQQTAANPIYGFYNDEKILESIKDIDSMFIPEEYDKQIFDTFQNELFGKADEIINLMQQWTSLKLKSFNDLYFKDEIAVDNLYKLINYNLDKNKNSKSSTKTIKRKNIKSISDLKK